MPETLGARPTGDRVREALFSILGGYLPGGTALDAFAGSGALGFEALSRGMSRLRWLHHGRAQLYVLYIVVTLILMLTWFLSSPRALL